MPIYAYRCPECDDNFDITKPMALSDSEECCDCGAVMNRDYREERPNAGSIDYAVPKVCESLGITPSQIKDHQRDHPDIRVRGDGALLFDNTKQEDDYYNKRGMYKKPQRQRKYRIRS